MTVMPSRFETPFAETRGDRLDAISAHLFRPMGADGVYARTGLYEDMVDALGRLITRQRDPRAEVFRFPPVMTRAMLQKSGYLNSFPNLLGCVSCLHGTEREIRTLVDEHGPSGEWADALKSSDLILTPASCYPVYPIAAARGVVPETGYLFDVACDCFRREPSRDIDRLQSFRMREYVCVADPARIQSFREHWIERAKGLADRLALPYVVEVASDPFFGRAGQMMAASQKMQELKFELLIPVLSEDKPTACMSFNYHQDHFGKTWDLRDAAGEPSHTGCVAFGMDRLAVALFATHGVDVANWPVGVREALGV
ncbi:amino acid--[acyl-carrier-protein] ligase [Caulobacter sp. S45]|uniref:amino acid--[acyl-carrier-protein] ligase n=1 Tax=Caulobacter sp. S45 TaxID=1641861 RepID=UPI001C20BFC6|nr:amino acid--[acyl-carrier-protein] ligase [Caulobacter sp. S45]